MDTKNECEDESRNVVQWVQHCVSQKHIKNGDVEQFVMHHDNRIWCPNELLVTVFYRDQIKHLAFLQILARKPNRLILQGPHWIRLYSPDGQQHCFWVHSLTSFRRTLLGATDRLSFERSTFFLFHERHSLVRLKEVRSKIELPGVEEEGGNSQQRKKSQLTLRTQNQMKHSLNQLFTSYVRDLHLHYSLPEILDRFRYDCMECSSSLL
jgi:hypothetical protein